MTQAAMKGADKDPQTGISRGEFVEIDPAAVSITLPQVRIDGPYGAPAEDVFNHEVAVLIGAGIGKNIHVLKNDARTTILFLGVTPFASILKHIWYRQKRGKLRSLRRVEFFWLCRDIPSFGWFQSLLQEVEAAQADRRSIFFFADFHLINHFPTSQLPPN
jgi:NADPH oxidase